MATTRSTFKPLTYRELRDICRKESFHFSDKKARRAIRFAERHIQHVKGEFAGQSWQLEKWQRKLIRRIFGWLTSENIRVVREVYIEIPRKNGKSFLGAFFALYLLFADREAGAEVVSAAADREQAALVYDVAKQIVQNDTLLNAKARSYKRGMAVLESASSYTVLSADAYTKHGKNLSGIIVDEVHAQPDRELIDVLVTSTSARLQPLTVYLTTAGHDRESICFEKHEYASQILDRTFQDFRFYPVIFAADPGDDWKDEKTWAKANPNLGVSKRLEYMRAECAKAEKQPGYENTFKRLELNIWTEQDVRWMPMDEWDKCAALPLDIKSLLGKKCYAGLDLSSKEDLTALSLVFPEPGGIGCDFSVLSFFFLPAESIARNPRYKFFKAHNHFIETPGNILDQRFVKKFLLKLRERYDIQEIAYDKWNADQLSLNLQDEDFEVFPFGQGFGSMSPPTKELMNLVLKRQIKVGANKILRWNASNATVKMDDAGNIKLVKKKGMQKIDGMVALVMALDRAMRNLPNPTDDESIVTVINH